MKKKSFIGMLLLIILSILALFIMFWNRSKETISDGNIAVIYDNVLAFTQEEIGLIKEINDNKLVFSKEISVTNGDVLVCGITEYSPSGFIRIIKETSFEAGEFIVITEDAGIEDVFEELAFETTLTIDGDDSEELMSFESNQSYSVEKLSSAEHIREISSENKAGISASVEHEFLSGLELDCSMNTAMELDVMLEVNNRNVSMGIVAHNTMEGNINIKSSIKDSYTGEVELLNKKLPSIQFYIYGIPVVITNQMDVKGELLASVLGEVETNLDYKVFSSFGTVYDSSTGKCSEIKEITYNEDNGIIWSTSTQFQGNLGATLSLHLVSKLYDSAGIDLGIGLGTKLEGNVVISEDKYYGSIDLDISPVINGEFVIDTPIIGQNIGSISLFEKSFEPLWLWSWQSSKDWEEVVAELKGYEQNTFYSQHHKIYLVDSLPIAFDYPSNWEDISPSQYKSAWSSSCEEIVLQNELKHTLYYCYEAKELGGMANVWVHGTQEQVGDTVITIETEPDGMPLDEPIHLVVAKLSVSTITEYFDEDDTEYESDHVIYAVLPESYLEQDTFGYKGYDGYINYCRFDMWGRSGHLMVIDAGDKGISNIQEKEIIDILSSIRIEVEPN